MKYGYYPGCSLHSTASEYDISVRLMCADLGIDLEEVDDWCCCGSSPAHNVNHMLSIALPARNLARAERQGLEKVIAPCAACFNRFRVAEHELEQDPALLERVNSFLDVEYHLKARVVSPIEVIHEEIGTEQLKAAISKPLTGLRPVIYYGCLLVRPPEVMKFDDPENPTCMDDIVRALGCDVVDWPFKTECCGGAFSISRTDIVLTMVGRLLAGAINRGANCIVTACPLCHANLDMRQQAALKAMKLDGHLPVFYISQLIGLAFGRKAAELGIKKHIVDAQPLVAGL